MRRTSKAVWVLLCLTVGLFIGMQAKLNAAPALVVVLLPGTSLQDWRRADAPHLHHLMQTGALAVMNTRTARQTGEQGRESPLSVLLTLGAGSRAAGPSHQELFLPASAAVPGTGIICRALFERRTGQMLRADQSACLDWPAILAANRDFGYDLRLGSLSDSLARHGVVVKSGGGPYADWIATGNAGTVRHAARLQAVAGQCLIWDAGSNLPAADAAVQAAAEQVVTSQGRLIILSAFAGDADSARNERLTPVLLWGNGIPAGLICSPSTRRPGLVTDTDFAPAVAGCYGIPRTELRPLPFGFAWTTAASPQNADEVGQLDARSVRQAQGIRVLPYLAAALGLWVLAVTLLSFRAALSVFWILVPQAVFFSSLLAASPLLLGLLLFGLLALIRALLRRLKQAEVLTVLTAVTALIVVGDILIGDPLMRCGLLGYSAIEGARYYGIGNEAMGLLLGTALTASASLWNASRQRQVLLISVMAVIVLLLGTAGAKAGGVLVSLAVFGVFVLTVFGQSLSFRTAGWVAAVMVAGITAAALGDVFLRSSEQSHIGEAVRRIVSGGSHEALDIIRRKLSVEGRLAYHSAWAVLLWAGTGCTLAFWRRSPAEMRKDTALRAAGNVGLVCCLLLNDAGVVAAAMFVTVLWSNAALQKISLPSPNALGKGG